jgi:hypothetical protein
MMILLALLAAVPGALNPAVTQATIGQTICVKGWTTTVRPPELYTEALKYKLIRLRHGKVGDYELDHLISLGTGGAPRDPRNLWLQPYAGKWGAKTKDKLEVRLQRLVCVGKITLKEAQDAQRYHWHRSYRKYVR